MWVKAAESWAAWGGSLLTAAAHTGYGRWESGEEEEKQEVYTR